MSPKVHGNGKEIDDCVNMARKFHFLATGWAFALDREPSNG